LRQLLVKYSLHKKNEEIYKAKLEEKLISKVTTAIKEVENYKSELDSQKENLDIRAKKQIIFEKRTFNRRRIINRERKPII
jgi:DNA integrity scanning protein DisA with diadenylate cyclase activity